MDWRTSDQLPTACITDAIATVTGVPGTDQRPIYESVDPDALDSILDAVAESPRRQSGLSVSFHHHDCEVVITADGGLSVTRQTSDR
jgi:hypothetical protein